jgi:hypothetical protein
MPRRRRCCKASVFAIQDEWGESDTHRLSALGLMGVAPAPTKTPYPGFGGFSFKNRSTSGSTE